MLRSKNQSSALLACGHGIGPKCIALSADHLHSIWSGDRAQHRAHVHRLPRKRAVLIDAVEGRTLAQRNIKHAQQNAQWDNPVLSK